MCHSASKKVYSPREPEKSPFFQIVSKYFDEFERIYSEKYQKTYGFWRPVIRRSIDKFIKCGDLREGFARVKCTSCDKEMFVPFSCRQRCCCPSCHQKRVLLLAYHLGDEVIEQVPHRQFVFTIPKRFRIFFRYNRKLLGKLSLAAWETVRDVFIEECGCQEAYPGMISGVQTFGDLINFHPHIHALVPCGIFLKSGCFVPIDGIPTEKFLTLWQKKVFALLLNEDRITPELIADMSRWRHSGFSMDQSVYVEKGDNKGIQRIIEYMARCPFSLSRVIKLTDEGKVLYRTGKSNTVHFPILGDKTLKAGIKRNFEVFDPCDFLAEVTQHIPDRGEHQIRYYGWYSNKMRGQRTKREACEKPHDEGIVRKNAPTWAMLIKCIFEVDPLKCPDCGEKMRIVSFIEREQKEVIEKILSHCGLWIERQQRGPPDQECELVEVDMF